MISALTTSNVVQSLNDIVDPFKESSFNFSWVVSVIIILLAIVFAYRYRHRHARWIVKQWDSYQNGKLSDLELVRNFQQYLHRRGIVHAELNQRMTEYKFNAQVRSINSLQEIMQHLLAVHGDHQ